MAYIYTEFKDCFPLLIDLTTRRLYLCIKIFSKVCSWQTPASYRR